MTNFTFQNGITPVNGLLMDRKRTVNGPSVSWKLFTLLFALFLCIGQMWGANYTGSFANYTGTLIDGYYLIVASNSASSNANYAMGSTADSNKRIAGTSVTISSNAISNPNNQLVFLIESNAAGTGFCFKNYNTGKYVYYAANSSGKALDYGTTAYYHTLSGYNSNSPVGYKFTIAGSASGSNNVLKYNTSSKWFSGYSGAYSTSMTPVRLFRLAKFRAKTTQPASGSFTASATSATWDATNKHLSWMSSGATVTLTATPPNGKEVNAWTVTKASGGTVSVSNNQFTMPADQVTISVTWKDATPAYTITPATNDEDMGTVSISGNIITGSPKSGCRYASPAYTVTSGTATVSQSGNAFTVTPSTNCTVTINFEAIPTHKAYFYNGTTLLNTGGTSFQVGAAVSYSGSDPESCDTGTGASTTFAGWATGTWEGKVAKNAIGPDFYESTLPVMGDEDVTYHAVFCKAGSNGNVSISGDDLKTGLSGSYGSGSFTKSIGGTNYTFNTYACVQNSTFQTRASDGYIQIPTLPGAITNISSSACNNAGTGNYNGTLRFKSAQAAGSSTDYDIATKAVNATTFSWDISSSATSGYITTSAGLRLSNLTITYETEGSNYMTTCCTPLGQINGAVSCTSGTAATLSWSAVTGAESYKVKVPGSSSHNDWTTATSGVSVTGLTAGQNYTAYFKAFDSNGSHCTEGPESTKAFTTPKITVTGTPSAMSYNQGSGPSAPQSFTVAAVGMAGDVTVSAPTNFEVSTSNNSGYASSVVLSPTSGTVSTTTIYVRLASGLNVGNYPAAGTSNVTVSGNYATTVNVAVSGTVANPCSAVPTVSAATSSAKTMTSITVNCAGLTALGTGGCTVDHYGFVYGTTTAPKHPSDNSGTGTVKEVGTTYTTTGTAFGATTITDLTKATKYYIRPYAHNDCGWAYGNEIEVTTLDLKSLSVTAPTKVAYFQGETFASAGAVVTVTYTDDSQATVTTSATWDLTTLNTTGAITATASYTENGSTKTATTTINVYSVTVNMVKEDGETPLTSGPSVSWTLNSKTIAANEESANYAFKQWNVIGATAAYTGNASTTLSNPTANVTATAVFYNPRTVTKDDGTGTETFTISAEEVKYNSSVTVTCAPADGYKNPWTLTVTPSDGATYDESGSTGSITISNITKDISVDLAYVDKGCTTHGALSITDGESIGYIPGPVDSYYKHSARQIIYTKSDLGLAPGKKGTIKAISFQYSYSTAMSKKTNVDIYLANTELTSLSTSSYVPFANFTKVYSGALNCSGNGTWNEFEFSTSFEYNGVGQLVVLIDDNSNQYDGSNYKFKYHTGVSGAQIYKRSDDTNIDPSSASTWTSATPLTDRPNTKFCIQEADMVPATVTLMDNSATLTEESAGAGVTLPSRDGCEGYTFAGWTKSWTSAQSSWTTTAPTIIPAGSYTPSADENLYPVYTKTEGGGSGFKLSLNDGGTDYYVGQKGSGNYMDAVTNEDDAVVFTFADGYLSFDDSGTKTYISSEGDNTTLTVGTSTPSKTWTESGTTTVTYQTSATGNRYLGFNNNTDDRFAPYGSTYPHAFTKHPTSTTSYISVPDCCIELPTIGKISVGSINETGGTATWSWSGATTGVDHNVLKVYNTSDDLVKTIDNISGSATSQSISGLVPCTSYYVTLTTVAKSGYCAGAEQGTSDNFTTNGWAVHYTGGDETEGALLSNVTKQSGADRACLSENYVATFTANTGYKLPDNIIVYIAGGETTAGDDYTWAISNGTGTLTVFTSDLSEEIDVRIIGECVAPTFTVHPASKTNYLTTDVATALNYTASAAGASMTQQWQISSDNTNWDNIAGAAGTAATYTPDIATEGTKYYRVVVTNATCSASSISNVATITSIAPSGYCISLFNSNNNGIQSGFSNGGSGNEYTLDFTIPGKDGSSNWPQYWIGENNAWASYSVNANFADMKFTSSDGTLGLAEGATGTLHIWDDNKASESNLHVKFEPSGYGFRWGDHNSDDWTAEACTKAFTVDANNANTYWTELVTLDGTNNTGWDYYVGLQTASGYVYSGVDNEASDSRGISRTRSVTTMKVSNGTAGSYKATFLDSEATGTTGKFRIWNNNITDYNFVCHFVPFYQLKYNANGGSGTMNPLPATPVSCEESAANRTVTVAANAFTAPTGKQFVKWNTAANGSGADVATGAYELTGDVTLYAIWADADYTVTVNQSPAAGATTTGQTNAAHYGATIILTTTVPDGYEFVNWTSSDVTISNPTSEDGASFTMPAQDVTVTANFQQIYTITWSANGVTTTSTVNAGNKLVLPASDPTSCNAGYSTFIGWYSVAAGSAEEPSANVSGTKADANHTPTGNETWYAVWANGELVGGWQKVTSIAVGDVVLFVHEESYKRELTGVSSDLGTATAYESSLAGTYPLTIMAGNANNSYAFKNGNNYLSYSGTGNNLYTSTTLNDASSWTISASDGGNFKFANAGSTSRILQFNNGQPRWACYTSSQQAFQIYKQIPSATEFISGCCTDWSAPAISYSIPDHWKAGDGDVAVTIAPGTTHGAVSFESSDDDVLTVDAETGAIHAVAVGTATVTATWAGGVVDAVRYCTALSTSAEISVSGTVTITFNGNDATSGSMDNQVIYYNEATALSTNAFSRTGYTFYGWAETEQKADAGNRDYENGESVTFTTNKTLYAAWHANKHKVTLNEPTGISIEATGAADLANVDYGTSITLSAEESDGYVFTGWSVTGITLADATANPAVFSMPDNDVTVTATYSTYEWIVADPRYSVTTDPKTSYYKVEKFSTAGVVIKENFKRSDDNTITKQETYSGAWTAKLDGTPIANGADLSLDDDGKTLKLYIGETEIASYTLTVLSDAVDRFVVDLWNIDAPTYHTGTYTMPKLDNQTEGASECELHNLFVGWVEEAYMDDPKEEYIVKGDAEGIVADDKIYHAVWGKSGTVTKSISYGWETSDETTGWSIDGGTSTSYKHGGDKSGNKTNAGAMITTIDVYASPVSFTAYCAKASKNKNENNMFKLEYASSGSDNWTTIASSSNFKQLSQGVFEELSANLTASIYANKRFRIKLESGAEGLIDDVTFSYQTTGATDYIVDCDTRYEIEFYEDELASTPIETIKHKAGTMLMPGDMGLSKEYHTFAGWKSLRDYTESAVKSVYAEGEEYTVTENDYLYAQWDEFDKGTVTIDGISAEYYATQPYTLSTPDPIDGKKFIGWSDGVNIVAPGEYTMPEQVEDIVYTSQWFDLLPTPTSASFTDGEWILVTDVNQLYAGDFVVVAAVAYDYALGAQKTNNREIPAVTKSGNTLSYESDVKPLFLQNGYGANQYALYDMSYSGSDTNGAFTGGYLYAASSTANQLKTARDYDKNGSWKITIANGTTTIVAQGDKTHNNLQYAQGSGTAASVFSCYYGDQKAIAIYKWIETVKTEGVVNASDVVPTYNVNLVVQTNTAIDMNVERTVNDFYIEAQEGESGQIKNPENLHINGNAYYDLTLNTSGAMDNSKWYAFAVPFQIDAATGIQRLSNDGVASTAQFNGHYVLLKYNSEERAKGNTGWQYVTAGEKLMPGRFYMVALNSNAYNRLRMTKDAGAAVNNLSGLDLSEYTDNGTADAGDKNWNALANNALAYANVSASGDNASLKVQTYISATNAYDVFAYDEVTFTVGTPFFVQAAASGTMDVTIAASNNETVKAPKFYDLATEEFQIRLGADTESYYDKLYVSASEEALDEYQIGHDLAKAGVSTTVPQMYVPAYGSKLCDAEFPLVNNQAVFPLTFTTPTAGTYQLYVKKAAQDAKLYLLRDGNVIWDLTMSAYAIELPQGTTENYSLKIVATPKTPTGLENTEYGVQNTDVQKVIINDQVFILRGGQMYDVTGKMVK